MTAARRVRLLLFIAGLGSAACESALGQQQPPVLGRMVRVDVLHGRVRGELLAVSEDTLWLLRAGRLEEFALRSIRRVDVRRHGMTGSSAWRWGLIGWVATSAALTAACSSVGDGCGVIFVRTAAPWALFTSLAALELSPSSRWRFQLPAADDLRPYARFPQGWPPGLVREDVVVRD